MEYNGKGDRKGNGKGNGRKPRFGRALTTFGHSMRNMLTKQNSAPQLDTQTATTAKAPSPPPPNAQNAFSELHSNPAQFMRRNELSVRGQLHAPGGNADWLLVSQGQLGDRTRRSSVTGESVPLHSYKIMSQHDYDMTIAREDQDKYDVHSFTASHIHMDPMPRGRQTDLTRPNATQAPNVLGRKQNHITNGLYGCTIMDENGNLVHLRPSGGGAGSTFNTGKNLQDSTATMAPDAHTFGPNDYSTPGATMPVNVFIQSSRRGSVHIYGQSVFNTDPNGASPTDRKTESSYAYFPGRDPDPLPLPQETLQHQQARMINRQQVTHFNQSLDTQMNRVNRMLGPEAPEPHDDEWD